MSLLLYYITFFFKSLIGCSAYKLGGVLAPVTAFYIRHIYLMSQSFDYGYNMQGMHK